MGASPSLPARPKLRRVDRFPLDRDGEPHLVLHDPLGLSESVAVPALAGAVLDLLDGQRTPAQIRQSLLLRGKADLDLADVEALVDDLGEAGFLDDDRFRRRWADALAEFRACPARPTRFDDLVYPGDPAALREHLEEILGDPGSCIAAEDPVIGVVLPHQPYAAIGELLRATVRRLPRAEDVDLVVILGADHHPGLTPYAITDRPYATPFGVIEVDRPRVDALSQRLEWLRQEEIRHRSALSTELAAVLLRHVYGERTPPILPILCGPAALLAGDTTNAAEGFYAACERLFDGLRILWWTVAELHHGGPAYGRPPLPEDATSRLLAADQQVLGALVDVQARTLERRCLAEDPLLGAPSGGPALVTLTRLLPIGTRGELRHHRVLPAAGDAPGLTGVAGVHLVGARRFAGADE
ncbi:MAG: AmmeMemoRadiSam system protein B [Nannocystaceae bacterium]